MGLLKLTTDVHEDKIMYWMVSGLVWSSSFWKWTASRWWRKKMKGLSEDNLSWKKEKHHDSKKLRRNHGECRFSLKQMIGNGISTCLEKMVSIDFRWKFAQKQEQASIRMGISSQKRLAKICVVIELTSPMEENISKRHRGKNAEISWTNHFFRL